MASSMTTGERRWASARRGGMTVLGKVAVPKPINLPSQRLENHGLNPNVEIVPKGTLSWGSQPSSSGSNAWGSSVLSPRNEGGGGSPCHLSGCPSSGGGCRPSTACSEITHESTSNLWTSSSRPYSASGALTSNNTSLTALRPRSAETRPGSSQLSRFAEHLSEGSGLRGPSSAADKLGVGSLAGDGFSLSSGDFPTLGSEKCSGKNVEVLDNSSHHHPGSSSSGPHSKTEKIDPTPNDGASQSNDVKGRIANSQIKDSPQHIEDGPRHGMETWHGDPYPFPNANIPPQSHPYEVWHGVPPVNPQGGVWYRGPPGAPHPSYGGPLHPPPGGYPMEAFPYYRPQVPGPGLPNSQSVLPQGTGPRGPHSKNGDVCRPLMEPYMHPGMPMRPCFYPGYYGPPMGYCNPNERDFPYMGMPPGPSPAYNRYPIQNMPELSNSHSRNGEGRAPEESGPLYDSHGQYSAPVKHNSGWENNDEEVHVGHKVMPNTYIRDRGHPMKSSVWEDAWAGDHRKDEPINHGKRPLPSEEANTLSFEHKDGSSNPSVKFNGNVGNMESAKPVVESVTCIRDHSLIQKIEGLNAKARASDGRHVPYDRLQVVDAKPMHSVNEARATIHLERHHPSGVLVPVSSHMNTSAEGKSLDSSVGTVTTMSRRSAHVVQGKGDYHAKGRFNSEDSVGRQRRSAILESPNVVPLANPERNTYIQAQDVLSMELSRSDGEVKVNAALPIYDPCDSQRAKMREMAKQRAAQLQKEEEERIREQKAKALAKLEELNRRSGNQSTEALSQRLVTVVSQTSDQVKEEKSEMQNELNMRSYCSEEMSSTLVFGSNVPLVIKSSESCISSGFMCSETHRTSNQDPVPLQNQPLPAIYDACINDDTSHHTVSQFRGQQCVGYKQKQSNVHSVKNSTENQVVTNVKDNSNAVASACEVVAPKAVASASSELNATVELRTVVDSSVHQRKRSNKAVKNKHKVEKVMPREPDLSKSASDATKLNASELKLELDTSLLKSPDGKDLPHEEAHGKTINSWKPQHQRRAPRNSQGRPSEKSQGNEAVVWAPVKQQNKIEATKGNVQNAPESASPTKDHVAVQSTTKSKRAEMERYVPKPVAEELAQQSNIQQPSSASVEQSIPDSVSSGSGGKESFRGSERTGKPVEPRHVESGKPRQIKAHGSWHQRGSTQPTPVQGSEDSSSFNANQCNDSSASQSNLANEQSSKGSEQLVKGMPSKPDEWPVKGQQCKFDENQAVDDGWSTFDEPIFSSIPAASTGVKAHHGAFGKGRKNPSRGHRGGEHHQNFEQKNAYSFEPNAHAAPPSETIQSGNRPTSSKENHIAQWQRKAHLAHEQQGNRNQSCGWQTVTGESEKIAGRETSQNRDSDPPSHGSQDSCAELPQPVPVQSASGNREFSGMQNMGYQECKRERKNAPARGLPYSPNKEPLVEVESGAVGDGNGNNQRPSSSGFRKNGNYNGRFERGLNFQGDRSFTMQDSTQNYTSSNKGRERQNSSHYEYQPVGLHNMDKISSSGGHRGNRLMGQRFRERGPAGHSRRGSGGFYRRQGDNDYVQMDGYYK